MKDYLGGGWVRSAVLLNAFITTRFAPNPNFLKQGKQHFPIYVLVKVLIKCFFKGIYCSSNRPCQELKKKPKHTPAIPF